MKPNIEAIWLLPGGLSWPYLLLDISVVSNSLGLWGLPWLMNAWKGD